jgi:hypothetical protein
MTPRSAANHIAVLEEQPSIRAAECEPLSGRQDLGMPMARARRCKRAPLHVRLSTALSCRRAQPAHELAADPDTTVRPRIEYTLRVLLLDVHVHSLVASWTSSARGLH